MPSYAPLSTAEQDQTRTQRPSRHTPHSQLPPEVVAKRNQRERRRVTSVNDEFSRLQRLLPTVRDRARRVPKERLLRLAARYIRDLSSLLLTADSQTGSSPGCYPPYPGNQDDSPNAMIPKLEPPPPTMLSSLPGYLHGVDPLRMPALEDAIQGADHAGSAPYHYLSRAGVSAPGCGRADGTAGSYQQHFRFRGHGAEYDGSSSGVWDTSCSPGDVSVNLTYFSSSGSYSDCEPTVCSTLGGVAMKEVHPHKTHDYHWL